MKNGVGVEVKNAFKDSEEGQWGFIIQTEVRNYDTYVHYTLQFYWEVYFFPYMWQKCHFSRLEVILGRYNVR